MYQHNIIHWWILTWTQPGKTLSIKQPLNRKSIEAILNSYKGSKLIMYLHNILHWWILKWTHVYQSLCVTINQCIVNFEKWPMGPAPCFNFVRNKPRGTAIGHLPPKSLHTCTTRKIVGQYQIISIYLDLYNLLSLFLTNLSAFTILHLLMPSPYLLLIWKSA